MNVAPRQSNRYPSRSGNQAAPFNEALVKELQERFNRLVKELGWTSKTTKGSYEKGTERYKFEVDFVYAIREIELAPAYLKGKVFDKALNIVNSLIGRIKTRTNDTANNNPA